MISGMPPAAMIKKQKLILLYVKSFRKRLVFNSFNIVQFKKVVSPEIISHFMLGVSVRRARDEMFEIQVFHFFVCKKRAPVFNIFQFAFREIVFFCCCFGAMDKKIL